ncbi:hypothetical protein BH720_018140 [Desertifilum tharense IPPAS B-1220]|uniref:Uncharacterized protein n=1 Tax=Desertifilum tharense IPPAS B-1220 TaxID=1781255 RepID=A0ACD5GS92_9CYAN
MFGYCTDDDILLPNAVELFLNYLKLEANKYGLYVVNWIQKNEDLSQIVLERYIPIEEDEELDHEELFVKYAASVIAFMSCLIYNNSILQKLIKNEFSVSKNDWGFVYEYLALLCAYQSLTKIIATPLLCQRLGKAYYIDKYIKVFLIEFQQMILKLPKTIYSPSLYKKMLYGIKPHFKGKYNEAVWLGKYYGILSRQDLLKTCIIYFKFDKKRQPH